MANSINARFTVYTGTKEQWEESSVILLKGEIGLETDTGKFKFGNGVDVYADLSDPIPRALSELTDDETHRLVTDTEKATWDKKQDALTFDTTPTSGSANPVTSSGIKSALETLQGEIPDVSEFITKAVADLTNYYLKSEIDTTVEDLEAKISAIPKFSTKVVDALPTEDISTTTVYLVRSANGETGNLYIEYIYTEDGEWETLGTQTFDLSGYVTTTALNTALAEYAKTADVTEAISTALANYVKSSELATELAKKQDVLTFDTTPTANSTNPVTSGGIKSALDDKADSSDIPTALADLTDDATHRVVTDTEKTTWNSKQDKLTFDTTPTADSSNPVTSDGVYQALQNYISLDDSVIINGGEL